MRLCNLLSLNPLVWVEHLTIQLLWITAILLVTHFSPIYLVDESTFLILVLLKEMRMLGESKLLLNEMRMLGKSNVLLFLFLVLIKEMGRWGESRSSHRICSKKTVLKNFTISTRKHLCWSLFLIKLQAFLKWDSNTEVFLWILWNL